MIIHIFQHNTGCTKLTCNSGLNEDSLLSYLCMNRTIMSSTRASEWMVHADLPTVPDFPGQYRKYKPCPSVPHFCSKIPDFDGPGYGVKYLCATHKRDRPNRVNCV